MHVGSLPDVLVGPNTYEEPARGMWGIFNQNMKCNLNNDIKSIYLSMMEIDLIICFCLHFICCFIDKTQKTTWQCIQMSWVMALRNNQISI